MRSHDTTLATLPLEAGAERLLHWLERYPFQRAQDLVLALAPWEKRTTVYKHLASLEHLHLIERLSIGVSPHKQLYHLTPSGIYVCDSLALLEEGRECQEKQERQERWKRQSVGQVIQDEREKLVRMLPRLPVFLLLQDIVNGLVSNAGSALTNQGHRASLIQWNWLRDYGHTFTSPREQSFRLHVEGALALCLHFTSTEMLPPSETSENWYTLFLLYCPIDDVRLMRMRLDRILRWRESAERTSVYSQMPPILVLATTERQAEWWHQATRQEVSRLRIAPPLGAVACLPRSEEILANPWRLSWRKLRTKESCHLSNLLLPWPTPSVPELLALRGTRRLHSASECTRQETLVLPLRLRRRAFALAEMPKKKPTTHTRIRQPRNAVSDYRLASVLLTQRQWEILRLCFSHPLLSRADFAQLLMLSRITTNMLLASLEHAGYLIAVETLTGERWQLAEPGLRLLARLAGCHIHRLMRFPREEGKPLIQRGVLGLLHQIRHTAGVYAFFAQLSEALATRSDAFVQWWETGVISERHFQFREKTYRFRPDALATVQLGERGFRFWLEWDRGTMTLKDLQQKFTVYAMYLASREWANSSPYLPALLCVAPDIGPENQLIRAALQRLVQVPAAFCVYTTTAQLLLTRGILAPIWRRVELQKPSALPTSADGSQRIALFTENEETSQLSSH